MRIFCWLILCVALFYTFFSPHQLPVIWKRLSMNEHGREYKTGVRIFIALAQHTNTQYNLCDWCTLKTKHASSIQMPVGYINYHLVVFVFLLRTHSFFHLGSIAHWQSQQIIICANTQYFRIESFLSGWKWSWTKKKNNARDWPRQNVWMRTTEMLTKKLRAALLKGYKAHGWKVRACRTKAFNIIDIASICNMHTDHVNSRLSINRRWFGFVSALFSYLRSFFFCFAFNTSECWPTNGVDSVLTFP